MIEDNLPEIFKRVAYRPNPFFYAWKKTNLEKLFEEFLKSNIAVMAVEAIIVEEKILRTVPLKSGKIQIFEWKNDESRSVGDERDEQWYDFVERNNKEVLEEIEYWDLEKEARSDVRNRIYYHFVLKEE
jgi:hypothetical protein